MLNKIVLLDQGNLGLDLDYSVFEEFGEFTAFEFTDDDQVVERSMGAQIILTNKVKILKSHLNLLTELQGICVCASGTDNIDIEAARNMNIQVLNVSGYGTQSVAEHTMALYLGLAHNLLKEHSFIVSGKYSAQKSFTNLENSFDTLSNKKWGIIGLGAIGSCVASMAKALGAEVFYYSTSGQNLRAAFPHLSLKELLTTCDVISIHCPLNTKTKHLIDEAELALIAPSAYLINVARGDIINENALVDRLRKAPLNVALDVFWQEPIAEDHALIALSGSRNIILTPHVAWSALSAREKLLEIVLQNVRQILIP